MKSKILSVGATSPLVKLHGECSSMRLREEIQQLPEMYRIPLVRHYFDDRTHAQVAQETGIPRGSIARRIGEGLEQLRDRLLARGFLLDVFSPDA